MVSGAGIWRFIGTLNEDNGGSACYANASAANSTEASDGAGCVLKINPVSGAVTLCNYVAGSTRGNDVRVQQLDKPNRAEPAPARFVIGVDRTI